MIWLTWRQLRVSAAVVYGAGAVLAIALLVTGLQVADLAEETGSGFFQALASNGSKTTVVQTGLIAVLAVPAVIGVFWGAPLVARELEGGTHRLVWNQSITRARWVATRVGLTALAAAAIAGLLGLAVAWWCKPLDAAIMAGTAQDTLLGRPRMEPFMFAARGIVPAGYAVFALALGVAAGAIVRRVVPAMAITLALFVAVQVAVPPLVRSNLSPATTTTTITTENFRSLTVDSIVDGRPKGPVTVTVALDKPGAWVVGNETVDASGEAVGLPGWMNDCAAPPRGGAQGGPAPARGDRFGPCLERLTAEGYRQKLTYQPAGRFWTLQALETGAFLLVAALLAGLAFWRVRRVA